MHSLLIESLCQRYKPRPRTIVPRPGYCDNGNVWGGPGNSGNSGPASTSHQPPPGTHNGLCIWTGLSSHYPQPQQPHQITQYHTHLLSARAEPQCSDEASDGVMVSCSFWQRNVIFFLTWPQRSHSGSSLHNMHKCNIDWT